MANLDRLVDMCHTINGHIADDKSVIVWAAFDLGGVFLRPERILAVVDNGGDVQQALAEAPGPEQVELRAIVASDTTWWQH